MTILHVFPNSLFINAYLEFITNHFKDIKHIFIITDIGAKTHVEQKYADLFEMYYVSTFKITDIFRLNRILNQLSYNQIIIHSLYLNYLLISFLMNKSIIKIATLALWGGSDARKFTITKENRKYIVHAYVYEKLRKVIYCNVRYIATIVPEDYLNIKNIYPIKAKRLVCKYCVPTSLHFLSNTKKDNSMPIKIQLGHSGSIDSDTISAIRMLEKFKNENIKIYAPLAYGNDEYISNVIKNGKEIFGEKFIPMTELMSAEDFSKFIGDMDVLIMNTKIQQGLGNIYSYFYAKKNVYLNKSSQLWDFFIDNGFQPLSINEIDKNGVKIFRETDESRIENNFQRSKSQFNDDEIKLIWQEIFLRGEDK